MGDPQKSAIILGDAYRRVAQAKEKLETARHELGWAVDALMRVSPPTPGRRVVVVTLTYTGSPQWVESTLARSWVPIPGVVNVGPGRVEKVLVSDSTEAEA
jgi:hypothetical protein